MKKMLSCFAVFAVLFILTFQLQADVKKEAVTRLEFKGTLGMMMKVMGTNKPTHTAEYYKGDVLRSDTFNKKKKLTQSQIIDLENELFISIDHKKKRYTEMTFDEWREMMQKNMQNLESQREEQKREESDTKVDWNFDVDIDKTGETEKVAGHQTEKAVITLTLVATATQQQNEDTPEQTAEGELTVTSTHWLANDVGGQDEIKAFHKKLVEKLGFEPTGGLADVFARIAQSNPQLAEAMKKLQQESENLSGVSFKSHTVYATKASEMSGQEEKKEEEKSNIPTSVGGFMKGLGKKMAKEQQADSGENILMESTSKTTAYEVTSIAASEFKVPDDYKEK